MARAREGGERDGSEVMNGGDDDARSVNAALSSLPHCCSSLLQTHSPANAEAAQLYRENMKEYVRRVKVSGGKMSLDQSSLYGRPWNEPAVNSLLLSLAAQATVEQSWMDPEDMKELENEDVQPMV